MKKTLQLTLAFMLSLTLLAGCGSTPAAPSNTPTPTPSNSATPSASPSEPSGEALPEDVQAIVDRGVLRVGTKVDVPNFGYQNPDTGVVEGLEIDIAKEIAKRLLGDENAIQTQGVTAQTRGPLLDNGEVDLVIATFTITEERKLSYNFSDPYFVDGIGFLIKKSLGASSIKELDGKTIGVAQSATTRAALEEKATELGITFKFEEYASYPEIKTALSSGRVDAFSVDTSILLGYIDESTQLLGETFKPQNYGAASKLANKGLAAYVDEVLDEMEADGTLAGLIEKWGLGK